MVSFLDGNINQWIVWQTIGQSCFNFNFHWYVSFGPETFRPMDFLINLRTDTASASVSSPQFLFLCVFWTGTSTNGLFDGTVPNWYVKMDIPAQPRFRPVPVLERLLDRNINCRSVWRTAGRCSILRSRTVPVLASCVFWTETSTGGLFDTPPDAAASYGLERFLVLASCVFWTGDIEPVDCLTDHRTPLATVS